MSTHSVHEKLLEAVVHRATMDAPFRRQLLDNPAAAIKDAFGVSLPEGFRIRFVEQDPRLDAMVVLPPLHAEDEELSDDDLEQVAGGNTGSTCLAWSDPNQPPPPPPPPPPPGT